MSNKKTMKKSMVVTTVVMVLLLIAALSTATFAWYTANSNVSVDLTTVTSAKSDSANLVIDNQVATSVTANTSSVTLTMNDGTAGTAPMVYVSANAPVAGTTTYADFIANGQFYTFTQDASGHFAGAPSKATPAIISTVSGSGTSTGAIYLTNVGDKATNINVVVNLEPYKAVEVNVGDDVTDLYTRSDAGVYTAATGTAVADTVYYEATANSNLRIAVFAAVVGESTPADADLTLVGIYGTKMQIAAEAVATADSTKLITTTVDTAVYDDILSSGASAQLAQNVAGMGAVMVKVVAWFEGENMTNDIAGTASSFTMSFSA